MSLVFKLGYRDGVWIDKATGKTVYAVDDDAAITPGTGIKGVAANYNYGGYLYLADSLDFSFGAGDFTINTWWRANYSANNVPFTLFDYDNTASTYMQFWYYPVYLPRVMVFYIQDSSHSCTVKFIPSDAYVLRKFTHWELSRKSGDFYLFIDGHGIDLYSEIYTGTGWSHNFAFPEITGNFRIGAGGTNCGLIEDFSIYKGECLHTVGFNPSYPGLLPGFQVL